MKFVANTKKLKDVLEMEWVFQFLVGLNLEFDEVCDKALETQVFRFFPFPDLEKAFVLICEEKSSEELKNGNTIVIIS